MKSFRPARLRASVASAIVLLLLAIAQPAYAGGAREDSLSRIDKLINDRLYNQAIEALTAFIKENPTQFDDAQKRLQRVIRSRSEYNTTADKLLTVIETDPKSPEKQLPLIRKLEQEDPIPNKATQDFIARTKEHALFTYNQSIFAEIMASGRKLIDAGSYTAAAKKYSEGFALYKEEFDKAGYGDLVTSRVETDLATVRRDVDRLEALSSRTEAALKNFEQVFSVSQGSDSLIQAETAYDGLEAAFLEFAKDRNAVAYAGRNFENQFLVLQSADKNMTDSSFLPFAFRFVLGRKTEAKHEGIMGAMDTLWSALEARSRASAFATADRAFKAAEDLRGQGRRAEARTAYEAAAGYAELAMRSASLWAIAAGSEVSPALTSYGKAIVSAAPPGAFRYRLMIAAAKAGALSEGLADEFGGLKTREAQAPASYDAGKLAVADAAAAVKASRRDYLALQARVAAAAKDFDARAARFDAPAAAGFLADADLALAASQKTALATLSEALLAAETDAAADQYRIAAADLKRNLAAAGGVADKGFALLAGAATPDDGAAAAAPAKTPAANQASASAPAVQKFPKESIDIISAGDKAVSGISATAASLLASVKAEAGRSAQDQRVLASMQETGALGTEAAALGAKLKAALADAQDKVRQAESARLEGERRYEEARSALARQNFDVARERLQRAGERFDQSLSIQENAALRADRDKRLLALSAEITSAENALVVKDKSNLLAAAKKNYYNSVFDKAEEQLIQAQERWHTTNVADEPEVAYWLTLVRSALSVTSGRSIPTTAPLYPEMSQLLSFAQKDFNEGRDLLNQRKRTEALSRFRDAQQKLLQVKIVFPLNQDASFLSLRIDQLTDPEAFSSSFRRKIADAQAKLKNQPDQAILDLDNLAKINPTFPGLKAIIDQASIDVGRTKAPPDKAKLARSAELTAAAKRIVDANLRSQFPVAMEQLVEALKLNPDNDAAGSLKDRIQTDAGGTAAIVLTNASEKEYQRAVVELQKGNTIVALAIVEQLLTDQRNRNAPRILELQRRIQSRL